MHIFTNDDLFTIMKIVNQQTGLEFKPPKWLDANNTEARYSYTSNRVTMEVHKIHTGLNLIGDKPRTIEYKYLIYLRYLYAIVDGAEKEFYYYTSAPAQQMEGLGPFYVQNKIKSIVENILKLYINM